jgi:hypothetical protein
MLFVSKETGSSVGFRQKEKFKVLAEANGWSLEHARGYLDGEAFRLRGKRPSKYALVGIDDYCLGFRAGYFERRDLESAPDVSDTPGARI